METVFYATTQDEKNRTHHYRVSANDPAPEGHEITSLRKASVFQFGQNLSDETVARLWALKRSLSK